MATYAEARKLSAETKVKSEPSSGREGGAGDGGGAVRGSILTRAKKRKVASELLPLEEGIEQINDEQLQLMKEDEEEEEERRKMLFNRWLHSPERTKKWRNKMKKLEQAEQERESGPLADVWIQCEKPDCLKWRRLSRADSDKVDKQASWFCHMDTRPEWRSCSIPQEDFLELERLAARLSIKFVSSSLPEGTLVWAKTTGFVRWPALITKDYLYGSHVFLDADDEPLSYHVEYLGEKHTRAWLSARRIQLYGNVDEAQQLIAAAAPVSTKKKRLSTKSNKSAEKQFFRKNGEKVTQAGALREAKQLVDLPLDKRLVHIVFNQDSFTDKPNMSDNQGKQEEPHTAEFRPQQAKKGQKQVNKRQTHSTKAASSKSQPVETVACQKPEPSVSGQEAVERQLHQKVSLLNCTKEERFSLDIQMYARNEKAFEHDVHRFMLRHQRELRRSLCWQGVQVTPFQLFLAVHEKGGFWEVCENRQWEQVFREVTGCHTHKQGMIAKQYYRKNLLPYELYINNEDYEACLTMTKRPLTSQKQIHGQRSAQPEEERKSTPLRRRSGLGVLRKSGVSEACVPDVDDGAIPADHSDEEAAQHDLDEIDQMLGQLDNYNVGPINQRSKRDYDIIFYDESPPKSQRWTYQTESETHQNPPLWEPAQEVPDLPEYDQVVYTEL